MEKMGKIKNALLGKYKDGQVHATFFYMKTGFIGYSNTLSPVGVEGGKLSIDVVVDEGNVEEEVDELDDEVGTPSLSQRDQAKYEAILVLYEPPIGGGGKVESTAYIIPSSVPSHAPERPLCENIWEEHPALE